MVRRSPPQSLVVFGPFVGQQVEFGEAESMSLHDRSFTQRRSDARSTQRRGDIKSYETGERPRLARQLVKIDRAHPRRAIVERRDEPERKT